jgi:nucleoside-diphosphate-sugar epimerase
MGRYLLTGAAGFIGARVAEKLLEQGHTVIGIDNLNDAYDVRMKHWRLDRLLKDPKFIFEKRDVSSKDSLDILSEQTGEIDAVINLAARAGVRGSVINPWVYYDTNTTGALNLLEFCRQKGIRKFILASSSSVYGQNSPMPFNEDANTDYPMQPYAASKKAAEVLAYTYHYLYGIDVTVLRYFTVYGPTARPDMAMFRFTQWIAEGKTVILNGDGEQTRGYTYVDDIADGTILALTPAGYEIINLGGHEVISMNELIRMFEIKLGKTAIIEHIQHNKADALANFANCAKASRLLGWKPVFTLDKGVEELVSWYLRERSWTSQIRTE